MNPLLEVQSLAVSLPHPDGTVRPIIHDVSLTIAPGECQALVGESGSGKSMTARAIMRLLPAGAQTGGSITFDGRDVLGMKQQRDLRAYRGGDVGLIFQDPRAHVNPVRTVGDFMTEVLRKERGMSRRQAEQVAIDLLSEVAVDRPARRLRQYAWELSGGLLQRVMIASVLASEVRLLICDEPTTALDVTNQAEVMGILDEQRRQRQLAMLFITHDLDLAAAFCDTTSVMYAGRIVEHQLSSGLHDKPLHPYSAALSAARPSISETLERLPTVPGRPRSAAEATSGCSFADRCPFRIDLCADRAPDRRAFAGGSVCCHRAEELEGRLTEPFEGAAR